VNRDARVAEELAIRYADVRRGHRSGQFKGNDAYRQTRETCLATLSREIAANHGITSAQVMEAVGRRDDRLDAVVVLLFAAVYGFVANAVVTRLFVRFPADEPWPAFAGTAVSALFVSAAGVISGGLGASVAEMIWVGDTHLSYRAFRIPWSQHWLLFYFGGLALFCVIAGARFGFRDRGRKLAA